MISIRSDGNVITLAIHICSYVENISTFYQYVCMKCQNLMNRFPGKDYENLNESVEKKTILWK